jgi:hypothetical protein
MPRERDAGLSTNEGSQVESVPLSRMNSRGAPPPNPSKRGSKRSVKTYTNTGGHRQEGRSQAPPLHNPIPAKDTCARAAPAQSGG